MKTPSLRNRIAFIYTLSTCILISFIFACIYFIAAETMNHHFDSELKAEFAEVGRSMSIQDGRVFVIGPHEWSEQEHGLIEMSPVFLQANDTSGMVLRKSPNLRALSLPFDAGARDTVFVSAPFGGSHIRLIQGPLFDSKGMKEGYLLVAMDREEADQLLKYLGWVMFLSFPLIIAAIVIVSRLIGRTILTPVNTIINTAEHITRKNLDERIETPHRQDELFRLTMTINQLLSRLQAAVLREQQFTADAAHELRTPLAALKGTIEVLIRYPREPRQYEEKLRYCVSEIDRITFLVDQLLFLARHESGAMTSKPEDIILINAIQTILKRLEPLLNQKRLALKIDVPPVIQVRTDAAMLNTILENIISNGIKYSSPEQSLEISAVQIKSSVKCTIRDYGVGMTEEQIQNIFKRFYRADEARASVVVGSGLGLSVVKRLADLLNLELAVTSQPEKGTSFSIVLPENK